MYNSDKVKSLHIMLLKASAYVKSYDEQTRWIYFLIEDDDLLEYNAIWAKSVLIYIKNNLIANLSSIKKV